MSNVNQARRQFNQSYPETSKVVRLIAQGWNSDLIADTLHVSVARVAAVRANLTRGTYAPFVKGTPSRGFRGTCNF